MYKTIVAKDAVNFIKEQTKKVRRQLYNKICELEKNPFPSDSKKLRGYDDLYRIRSGPYRIIYTVKNEEVTVLVLRVAHRKVVYRRLP